MRFMVFLPGVGGMFAWRERRNLRPAAVYVVATTVAEGGARMLKVGGSVAARSTVTRGCTDPAGMTAGLVSRAEVSTSPVAETTATTTSSKSAPS